MNKKLLIGGGIVLLLLVVGGAWYMNSQSSTSMPTAGETPTAAMQQTAVTTAPEASGSGDMFSGSLTDLARRGGNYACTWTFVAEGVEQTGKVYVSGQRMAGEINVSTPTSRDMTMKIVGDAKTMKGWMESDKLPQKIGFQFALDKMKDGASALPGANAQAAQQFQQAYKYKCVAWTPVESVFQIPADVQFFNTTQ